MKTSKFVAIAFLATLLPLGAQAAEPEASAIRSEIKREMADARKEVRTEMAKARAELEWTLAYLNALNAKTAANVADALPTVAPDVAAPAAAHRP